jgi:hypothetical protein
LQMLFIIFGLNTLPFFPMFNTKYIYRQLHITQSTILVLRNQDRVLAY